MPDSISGIFNYCDRWCERCPFTARCRLFELEQKIARREDEENREFWEAMERLIPRNPEFEAILEAGFEANEDWSASLPGPDLEEKVFDRAERDPLIRSAFDYATRARQWLTRLGGHSAGEVSRLGTMDRNDALDVVEWYALQIPVKLTRAISGQIALDGERGFAVQPSAEWDEGDDEPWDDETAKGVRNAVRSDRDGSAKVVLIGIERSLGALTLLRHEFPDEDAAIRELQRRLSRLRLEVDRRCPGARTFVRPGFDEVNEGR